MPKKSTTFEKQFADEPKKIASKKAATKTPASPDLQTLNNPFFIATTGLEWMFARAKKVAILLIVLSVIAFLYNVITSIIDSMRTGHEPGTTKPIEVSWINAETATVAFAIFLLIILIVTAASIFLQGLVSFTAARVAMGNTVELGQAARAGLQRFWGVTALYLIMGIKILLWSLLAIVPGIIMSIRYSLAGAVYFAEEGVSPNQALKRSAALTKGSVMTVLASKALFNVLTFGVISELVDMGTSSVLYRQLKDIEAKGLPKPTTHWLSWLTTILLLALLALFVLLGVLLVMYANQNARLN